MKLKRVATRLELRKLIGDWFDEENIVEIIADILHKSNIIFLTRENFWSRKNFFEYLTNHENFPSEVFNKQELQNFYAVEIVTVD